MSKRHTPSPGDKPERNKGGRPKKEIDLKELEKLCEINPTLEEIAAYFRCDIRTISRRIEKEPTFRELIERGRALYKASQRRAFAAAARRVGTGRSMNGDSSMVIFQARQSADLGGLGYKNQTETEHKGNLSWSELVVAEAEGASVDQPGVADDGIPQPVERGNDVDDEA